MTKLYNIIYADPPWQYNANFKGKPSRDVEHHYSTMPTSEIMRLPIRNLCDNDCILFMWITYPKMQDALNVIKAWGFEYKTCGFIWVKSNKNNGKPFWGMGKWTRSNTEICLIATKGKPKRLRNDIHQLIYRPIEKHSKKPPEVRDLIVKLCGDLPRVELFSRQAPMGWDYWGNEVNDGRLNTV